MKKDRRNADSAQRSAAIHGAFASSVELGQTSAKNLMAGIQESKGDDGNRN